MSILGGGRKSRQNSVNTDGERKVSLKKGDQPVSPLKGDRNYPSPVVHPVSENDTVNRVPSENDYENDYDFD